MHTVSLKNSWKLIEKKQTPLPGLEIGRGNYIQYKNESSIPVLIIRPNRKLDLEPGTVISLNRRKETVSLLTPDEALTGLWVAYQNWSFEDMYLRSILLKNADGILERLIAKYPVGFTRREILNLKEQIPAVLENASKNFLLLRETFGRGDHMKFECLFKAHLRTVLAESRPEFGTRLMLNSYILSKCCLSKNLSGRPTDRQLDLFVGTARIRQTWEAEMRGNDDFRRVVGKRNYSGYPPAEFMEYVFLEKDGGDECDS